MWTKKLESRPSFDLGERKTSEQRLLLYSVGAKNSNQYVASGLPAIHEFRACSNSLPLRPIGLRESVRQDSKLGHCFYWTYMHIRDMKRIAKQVLNVRGRKGCATALSREYQRNWSDRAWQVAIAKGNYGLGRQRLNFQISKGGKIAPIDKSKSILH